MEYAHMVRGEFLRRDNRFVAEVRLEDGTETRVHVKNTGRCRELLVPGAAVYLEDHEGSMGTRKLRYSLITVDKETRKGILRINMDSQAPNRVVGEALSEGKLLLPGMNGPFETIRPETTFRDSRFDFYLETAKEKAFMEVKGVTLEEGGIARFPDAPTLRGIKHIDGLIRAAEEGYRAYIFFVIQMKGMHRFEPNMETHPQFGRALVRAERAGVNIMAMDCAVTRDSLKLDEPVPVALEGAVDLNGTEARPKRRKK